MSIGILTNIPALQARRALLAHDAELSSALNRLSSGQRINRPSDDAAGLSIGHTLRTDSAIASVAIRNVNDGLSAISTADTALNEIGNILLRMAELAENAANGVLNNTTRAPLQKEFLALSSEITRISRTTKFNGIQLLSASSSMSFQVGYNSHSTSQITMQGISATLSALGLGNASEQLMYSLNATGAQESQQAAMTTLQAVKHAIEAVSSRRGSMGAIESRLGTAVQHLSAQREQFASAASRILDADFAVEAARAVQANIKRNVTASILAQANQQPRIALSLLENK